MKEATPETKPAPTTGRERLPESVEHAIDCVVCHLWGDEEADYRAHPTDDHIFVHLNVIERWLRSRDR